MVPSLTIVEGGLGISVVLVSLLDTGWKGGGGELLVWRGEGGPEVATLLTGRKT